MNAVRQFVTFVIAVTVLGLAACNNAAPATQGTTPVVTPTPDPTPNPTPDPTPDPNPDPTPIPDTTAPTITSSQPENNSSGVSINSDILVNFSEAMNPNSVSVSINPSVNLGAASFKAENSSVQFNPPADLSGDTTYTVTVSGKDVAGNALTGSSSFAFKTATTADTTAPGTPQNLSATAGEGQVKLIWSANTEADLKGYTIHYGTDAGNLSSNTFASKPGSSKTITGLSNGTKYFFAIDAEDGAGNKSGRSSTVNATPKDVSTPTLLSSSPFNGSTNVAPSSKVVFKFSEPMNTDKSKPIRPCTALALSDFDSFCGTLESAVWSNNDTKLTLSYLAAGGGLGNKAALSFSFETAEDKAGNVMPITQFAFNVGDAIAPAVISSSPALGSIGVPAITTIALNFSEPMDRVSVQAAFAVGISGAVSWTNNDKTFNYQLTANALFGGTVTYQLGIGAKDKAGNPMAAAVSKTYRVINQATVNMPYYGSGEVDHAIGHLGIPDDDTAFLTSIRVGDGHNLPLYPLISYRGYLAFKINSIPANATLTAARLQVFLEHINSNPYGTLGHLFLDRVNPPQIAENPYSLSGNRGDFNLPSLACASCPRQLLTDAVDVDADVLDFIRADRTDGHAGAQFRLRFSKLYSDNGKKDYVIFSNTRTPILTVTYQYP